VDALLSHLLTTDPTALADTLPAWWRAAAPLRDRFEHPLERALALGLTAPSVGAAFVGGYRAALHRLVPSLGAHTTAALCASEDRGAHPKHIHTRLTRTGEGFTLDGIKRFVTGARDADALLVLAVTSIADDGTRAFGVVKVSPDAVGVRFEEMPATPFVPDVAHASVCFEGVALEAHARLDGDGWRDLVKPFRTVEDLHVQAAMTAWLLGVLRRYEGHPQALERLVAHALTLRALADMEVESAVTHVALAGAFATLDAIVTTLDAWWSDAPDEVASAWRRDRALLTVARGAREARRVKAWAMLRG
jgi:acyl-CoA dehydrogenase